MYTHRSTRVHSHLYLLWFLFFFLTNIFSLSVLGKNKIKQLGSFHIENHCTFCTQFLTEEKSKGNSYSSLEKLPDFLLILWVIRVLTLISSFMPFSAVLCCYQDTVQVKDQLLLSVVRTSGRAFLFLSGIIMNNDHCVKHCPDVHS